MKIAITGGAGFLGSHICSVLVDIITNSPDKICFTISEIRVIDLKKPNFSHFEEKFPSVEEFQTKHKCIRTFFTGSVEDDTFMEIALKDVDIVFHTVGIVDYGQNDPNFVKRINLDTTIRVAEISKRVGVSYFMYTSSFAVNQWKHKANINVKSNDPSPEKLEDFLSGTYALSKSLSEKSLFLMNKDSFKVSAIRPCAIYGEGDPYFLGKLLKSVKSGNYKFQIGNKVKLELSYAGNVAFAHIFVLNELVKGKETLEKQGFLVKTERPKTIAEVVGLYKDIIKANVPSFSIPAFVLIYLAVFLDLIRKIFSLPLSQKIAENGFTEISIRCISSSQTVGCTKLVDFGFKPYYSETESINRTRTWVKSTFANDESENK